MSSGNGDVEGIGSLWENGDDQEKVMLPFGESSFAIWREEIVLLEPGQLRNQVR
jgi:hypothetical protein